MACDCGTPLPFLSTFVPSIDFPRLYHATQMILSRKMLKMIDAKEGRHRRKA